VENSRLLAEGTIVMAEDRRQHADVSRERAASQPVPLERRQVYYSGRVQGVGFRQTSSAIASRLPVTGWVRNLSDGRVELVAEGAPDALDELADRIAGELGRFIRATEVAVRLATGEFSTFEITY
jgi:acylphosphatase